VHIHAVAEGLVRAGHDVLLLTSRYPACEAETTIRGVHVRRRGSWWNANFALYREALRELRRQRYDVVVEDVNKIPFFTPLGQRLPTVVYVPHLFGATVFRETNPLFATYVWLMERPLKRVYRRARWIAISESTRDDLVARGIPASRVDVVHCGLDIENYELQHAPARDAYPSLVHLGRLMRYKSIDVALRAMAIVLQSQPQARLRIVGDGPDEGRLRKLVHQLGLGEAVEFCGYRPHAEKVQLLWRSHLALNPSPKEGWGLTVVEANACGVPVVASRAPGLVDSVRHGETGTLVPYGDAAAFAAAALHLLENEAERQRYATRAQAWARTFDWNDAALQTEQILRRTVEEGV
jgi:glycosyltransferase involved in cell wall biosynthesis